MVDIVKEYNKEHKLINSVINTQKEKQIIRRAVAKNELISQFNSKCSYCTFDKYEMAELVINSAKPELVDMLGTTNIFTVILQAEIANLLNCNETDIEGAFDKNHRITNEKKALEISKCIIAKVLEID